jgi:hypothetical protein
MRFRRHDDQQPDPQPGPQHAPAVESTARPLTSSPTPGSAPPGHVRHDLAESVRIVTTPMPYDVAADHEGIPVMAAGHAPLADINQDPSYLLTIVLEELGRVASERGCDGLYSVHHTMAIDTNGTMYISAMGTGSRPTVNMDGPPPMGG